MPQNHKTQVMEVTTLLEEERGRALCCVAENNWQQMLPISFIPHI